VHVGGWLLVLMLLHHQLLGGLHVGARRRLSLLLLMRAKGHLPLAT